MNIIDLVYSIREKMYIDAINRYKMLLHKHYDENKTNEYISAIKFYQSLSDKDKKHVLFLLDTAIDDTVSNFLAWLDGAYYLLNQDKDVELKIDEKKMNINGYLSDIWKNLQDGVQRNDLEDIYGDTPKE
jgi:hypothetical protein